MEEREAAHAVFLVAARLNGPATGGGGGDDGGCGSGGGSSDEDGLAVGTQRDEKAATPVNNIPLYPHMRRGVRAASSTGIPPLPFELWERICSFMIAPPYPRVLLQNGTATLGAICRSRPLFHNPLFHQAAPDFESIRVCVPTVARLLHHRHETVMANAAWIVSYLTDDGDSAQVQAVITEQGLVERLVELLADTRTSVITPALTAIGNIISGTEPQTQCVRHFPAHFPPL